jgi:hypothetical protein
MGERRAGNQTRSVAPLLWPSVGVKPNTWKSQELESSGVAPLLWPSVRVKPNTWKSRELESSETPECSELDSKGQNTLHWGVLGVIEKVLKRRYRKWPLIDHLDICNPS